MILGSGSKTEILKNGKNRREKKRTLAKDRKKEKGNMRKRSAEKERERKRERLRREGATE